MTSSERASASRKAVWLQVDLETFAVRQEGFAHVPEGERAVYTHTGSAPVRAIDDLRTAEYAQVVEIDFQSRTVAFGRDYLGHYPLLFACGRRHLYISDDLARIKAALEADGVRPRLSEQALALYFAMGYVPHGMSAYDEITNCESAAIYRWQRGRVSKTSVFHAVEPDPAFSVGALGECLAQQAARFGREGDDVEVWCSGGLDSSVMAYLFNVDGRRAGVLTLGYGEEIHRLLGEGERAYAEEMARAMNARFRDIAYDEKAFHATHAIFSTTHNAPVLDTCVTPKYALAGASAPLVITGEGSDNLFGGPKNNQILYASAANPSLSPGWLYALAHKRFAERLDQILLRGEELKRYVDDYFSALLEFYPGDLSRKLFYMNLMLKAGSMIFAQSYYPGRLNGISIRHPFASMPVYEASFRLTDDKKYRYPHGKLCLIELYARHLPESIVNRKKSGTVLPLKHYLHHLPAESFRFDALEASDLFNAAFLPRMKTHEAIEADPLLVYSLVTLNAWLKHKGDSNHVERIPSQTRNHDQRAVGVGL